MDTSQIREHMEVVGSDGQHVGKVDKVEGQRIKLAKSDSAAGGQHRYVESSMVDKVDGNAVRLNCPAAQAQSSWKS